MKITLNLPDLSLANKGKGLSADDAPFCQDDQQLLDFSENVIELSIIAVRLYQEEKDTRHARKGGDLDGYTALDTRKQAIGLALTRYGLKYEDALKHLGASLVEYGALRWAKAKGKGGKSTEGIAEAATQIMAELVELPAHSYGYDNVANIDVGVVLEFLYSPNDRKVVDEKLYPQYKYAIELLLAKQLGIDPAATLSVTHKQIEEFAVYKPPVVKPKSQFQIEAEATMNAWYPGKPSDAPSREEVEDGGTDSFIAQEADRIFSITPPVSPEKEPSLPEIETQPEPKLETLPQIDMQVTTDPNRNAAIELAVASCGRENLMALIDAANDYLLELEPPIPGYDFEPDSITLTEIQNFCKKTPATLQISQCEPLVRENSAKAELLATEQGVIEYLQSVELAWENRTASPCVWVKPRTLTDAQAAELKELGFVWSKKREQWYFTKSKQVAQAQNIQHLTVAYAKVA